LALIKVERLRKVYRLSGGVEVEALREVSFEVKEGEYLSIMGPSGSGKSTLLYLLGCLLKPTSGKYFLKGTEVSGFSDARLSAIRNREIGFVFQSYNLLPQYNALKNVEAVLFYRGMRGAKRRSLAEEALKMVGLHHRKNHYPSQLSGGEAQRVAIARAVVGRPSIVLADEPTGNLDSRTGEEILRIFERLNSEGRTVILITHDPEVAERTHRTLYLRDGTVVDEVVRS